MERKKEEVIDDIKHLFQALFVPDSGWLVMICPVSLGKELATNKDEGKIEPINIHLPAAFAVYSHLTQMVSRIENEEQKNEMKNKVFLSK